MQQQPKALIVVAPTVHFLRASLTLCVLHVVKKSSSSFSMSSGVMRAALTDLPYNLPEKLTSHQAADCAMTRRLMSNTHCGSDTPYIYIEGANPYSHVYDIPFEYGLAPSMYM
jgi:hypothetical protein